eukprot:TRINITY_DN19128_c0_g1_i1.p1 TRINITY_DN19128_c0_g1~~TRINITY_DN19128_c0_g1_i1.p1  ORF type:complete len:160 (+),score=30.25 TRINITY_DN19128_c0_g1_i1:65-481(+)
MAAADYNAFSVSQELACSFEQSKVLADFATFSTWSGFPIYAAEDGKTRESKDGVIVENLEETFDSPDAFGYSYGFLKHLPSIPEESVQAMKGRFILRPHGTSVMLTWSWTFDVSANADKAMDLLKNGAAYVEKLNKGG